MPRRKATGRPDQQTEEVTHVQGTISGNVELVDEWPEGAELAASEVGVAAQAASVDIDARLAGLAQLDTHLCPDE
jgi:hypothetical protein